MADSCPICKSDITSVLTGRRNQCLGCGAHFVDKHLAWSKPGEENHDENYVPRP